MRTTHTINLDAVLSAYLDAALWSSTDDQSRPMDAVYGRADIAPEAVESARIAWAFFCDRAVPWLADWSDKQIGHDLWLTRNGHGSGFWDRGHQYGTVLADKAKALGGSDAYIGDDGKVYFT